MSRLVAAELLKFRTTRASLGLLVATLALTGIAAASTVGFAEDDRLGTAELTSDIVEGALFVGLFALLAGIVSVTSEWRHSTIARTFLTTPWRHRVLLAKEIWVVLLALGLAFLALALAAAIAVPWLALEGALPEVDSGIARSAGTVFVAAGLWGGLGVGIGALVQSQTPALVGAVVWFLLAESLIVALLGLAGVETVGDYLPGRALSALDGSVEDGLRPWAGGLVALGWAVALGLLGAARISRQDVT